LKSYFQDLCHTKKKFLSLCINFFEPYHGKSLVDGMFGKLSNWISEYKKTKFINSTDDLLDCFLENNQFLPFPDRNFFFEFSPDVSGWDCTYSTLPHKIKIQKINFFQFRQQLPGFVFTYTLQFSEEGGQVVYKGCLKSKVSTKTKAVKKVNKAPKFSKDLGIVNTNSLTIFDQELLKGKANLWNIEIAEEMEVEVEVMDVEI
jgi:hypothetical protein